MGLPSLKQKIADRLSKENHSQAEVLYLLIEMGKYLERSKNEKKYLGDPDDLRLKISEYPNIMFFRNWVAHTEKDHGAIPEGISESLEKALDGENQEGAERELFLQLTNEIEKFAGELHLDVMINLHTFVESLKCILAEQPVTLSVKEREVGFDDALVLREL